jgi:DNA-directed RNA polymerase subunit beta'
MEDAVIAYNQGVIDLHSKIWLRYAGGVETEKPEDLRIRRAEDGTVLSQYVRTTVGRIIFNQVVQETLVS